mgnify:FL=1
MTDQAGGLMLLADHTKIGISSRINYASVQQIGTLISDQGAATLPALAALQQKLPQVLLV